MHATLYVVWVLRTNASVCVCSCVCVCVCVCLCGSRVGAYREVSARLFFIVCLCFWWALVGGALLHFAVLFFVFAVVSLRTNIVEVSVVSFHLVVISLTRCGSVTVLVVYLAFVIVLANLVVRASTLATTPLFELDVFL